MEEPRFAGPVRQPRNPGRALIRLSIVVYGSVLAVAALAVWAWYWFQPPPQVPGMVYIPVGTFLVGADKHPVKLHAFYIDATEVSNAEYSHFCEATGCAAPEGARNLPMVNVTIEQARSYARWIHKRLPTPLEWERAARGKDGALFPWGDAEDPLLANVSNNPNVAEHTLMPVRSFGAYPTFQMIGNAWEMVEGDVKSNTGPKIAIRGGSYLTPLSRNLAYDSKAILARSTAADIGFRCVKDP